MDVSAVFIYMDRYVPGIMYQVRTCCNYTRTTHEQHTAVNTFRQRRTLCVDSGDECCVALPTRGRCLLLRLSSVALCSKSRSFARLWVISLPVSRPIHSFQLSGLSSFLASTCRASHPLVNIWSRMKPACDFPHYIVRTSIADETGESRAGQERRPCFLERNSVPYWECLRVFAKRIINPPHTSLNSEKILLGYNEPGAAP